ncbi:hypothetical protein AOH226_14910 [Helicobacter pylori]
MAKEKQIVKIHFEGLDGPKQRAAAARLAKDITRNGIEDVERRARNCSKLEHKVGELEAENKEFREFKNDLDKFRDDMKELVRREVAYQVSENSVDTQTQKYIYFQNDDSQGSLIKIH